MTDLPPGAPPRPGLLAWLPLIGTAAMIAGLLLTSGGYLQQLKDLVANYERQRIEIAELRDRVVRIEAHEDIKKDHKR